MNRARIHGFDEVYDVCEAQLERAGAVESSDEQRGELQGSARESKVVITVDATRQGLQRVTVTARKLSGFSPDLDTAQWIADAITRRLATS
ncbi:MAG: hypothetical protein ISR76_11010 [Planctomycetes bacterium]|nr:hypothetical protein [Planctomycetota bacterium]